ncbi:hypothetical protein [Coraliomargarita parva]|uniref:hypothetical protein n=1 Tax=Coraliomargarita parva TaxID=3014050 RepID=UPI0022B435DD|nr:hypothetical protein [Coraliomargarita parva]
MDPIKYPRASALLDQVVNQDLLNLTTNHLMSWQQGAGNFGALHFHACWGNSSVLQRRYHGQTVSKAYVLMNGFTQLYDHTKDDRWLWQAEDLVANIISLQAASGGFFHASGPHEPTYVPEKTCPIAQAFPLVGLLEYARWSAANPKTVERIRITVKKHLDWFVKEWWLKGTDWSGRLSSGGFCGVANQDLVVVAAMARYAEVFGDDLYYRKYGKPTLDLLLSPAYFHEAIGLFERGDKPNFTETVGYHIIVLNMLDEIHESTGDARIPGIVRRSKEALFDSIYEGPDSRLYFAWGAETDPNEKTKILNWIRQPYLVSEMLPLSQLLQKHLDLYPDAKKQTLLHRLEQTIPAYIYADGSIPSALNNEDPLFMLTGNYLGVWTYTINRMGAKMKSPPEQPIPCVHRSSGSMTWKTNQQMWSLELDGVRRFAGLKMNPMGVAIGPDEQLDGADFEALDRPDCIEEVESPLS